jgi:hypothetical protein
MFEKTGRLAEKLAISVSRRGFLSSVGRWAGATALAVAGVLTAPGSAQAGRGTAIRCCLSLPQAGFCAPPSSDCTIAFTCVGTPTGHQCIWNCGGTTVYTDCYTR